MISLSTNTEFSGPEELTERDNNVNNKNNLILCQLHSLEVKSEC